MCENIGSKQYKSLSSLAKFVPNMLYYCNHNKCYLRIKRIVADFVRLSADESVKLSDLFESSFQRFDKSLVSTLTAQIGKCIEDFGAKIGNLLSSQSGLLEEADSFSKSLQDSSVPFDISNRVTPVIDHASASCATQCIVDELA